MSVTGIVAALTAEARTLGPLRPGASGNTPLHRLADGTLLAVSGMGAQAAGRAALSLLAAGADALMSFGLAGALEADLRAGAILVPHAVIDGQGGVHATYAPWRERLAARVAAAGHGGQLSTEALLSVEQPLMTLDSKSRARERTGACAADMESFAIAAAAAHAGVSFAALRVVVDTATDGLPSCATAATGAYGEVSLPRLLGGLAHHPTQLTALLRLGRRYRAAMRVLRLLRPIALEIA